MFSCYWLTQNDVNATDQLKRKLFSVSTHCYSMFMPYRNSFIEAECSGFLLHCSPADQPDFQISVHPFPMNWCFLHLAQSECVSLHCCRASPEELTLTQWIISTHCFTVWDPKLQPKLAVTHAQMWQPCYESAKILTGVCKRGNTQHSNKQV